jgi:uncharacterized protein (TIGR00255 family)
MTGFGTARETSSAGTATVQLSTVNGKSLQIHLRNEVRDLALDEAVRQRLRDGLVRGSVTATVQWVRTQATSLDTERLTAAWRELAALAITAGAPTPTLDTALSCLGHSRGNDEDPECAQTVLRAVDAALVALTAAREQEGAALVVDLRQRAGDLRQVCLQMRSVAAARLPRVREALVARLQEALGATPPLPEEVLARELAIQADRLDVSEELTRLDVHLDALDALLVETTPVGRKLDFLLQEVGREVNTTGSKSNDSELTALVLNAKSLLEQVREQAANIE